MFEQASLLFVFYCTATLGCARGVGDANQTFSLLCGGLAPSTETSTQRHGQPASMDIGHLRESGDFGVSDLVWEKFGRST